MSEDVHQFASFTRANWPQAKHLPQVKSVMELIQSNLLLEQGSQPEEHSGWE